MKTKREVERLLRKHKAFLRERFSVRRIGVFGSCARGSRRKKSDIDILVEFDAPIGWEFIDLKEYLEEILGTKVDLVTTRALKPELRESILNEVVFA